MQSTAQSAVGIDVGKDMVMVASAQGAFAPLTLARQRKELLGWLHTLPAATALGVEATGGYHELVAELAYACGCRVYVLNPRDIRRYAEGLGMRAKTDRVDAQVIARYVAEQGARLHPFVPLTPAQKRLRDLQRRRTTVVKASVMLRQSLGALPELRAATRAALDHCARLVRQLDRAIQQTVASVPAQAALWRQLQTIDGMGPCTSLHCAGVLQRLPLPDSDAVVAFYGLDPRARDSGRHRGRRRLSKRGPAEGRRLLFNAAMAASRTKTWHPLYQHLRTHGFRSTEAIIIIARRMLRIAFAMFKSGTNFNSTLVPKPLT